MIRVAVIEDHRGQREGLRALIDAQEDMVCTGAYFGLQPALQDAEAGNFAEVYVIDYHLPKGSGLQCMEGLRRSPRGALASYLILSIEERPEHVKEAFSMGADAYLARGYPKRVPGDTHFA